MRHRWEHAIVGQPAKCLNGCDVRRLIPHLGRDEYQHGAVDGPWAIATEWDRGKVPSCSGTGRKPGEEASR